MSRTEPSRADRELMQQAAADGHPISATQLERWRNRGLMPRSQQLRRARSGSERVYPAGTEALVRSLARHSAWGRSHHTVALLAYFDNAAVPEVALRTALAYAYFLPRTKRETAVADRIDKEAARMPIGDDAAEALDFDHAEAEAHLELGQGGRAIRQMRANLRRLPDLQNASREDVEARLHGVCTALNRLRLDEEDLDMMEDLAAALNFEVFDSPDGWVKADALAVWDWAAVSHASQIAEQVETSAEERLNLLFSTGRGDLDNLRDEVREHFDQLWARATWWRQSVSPLHEPSMVRGAAAMLVEWMSARQVHPPGSVLAERYFTESLAPLMFACHLADLRRAARRGAPESELDILRARLLGGPGRPS
ncbi:hypothetical protein [Kitasatospora sp. NPDC088779]|uniref:hypothetical protein n=1 Tax=Kitasatospora sp. NPDC088779 TaxID=3154964 RepID=UPI00344478DA